MINLKDFIKKLIAFDVIWGVKTKILTGIKDGGSKASEINDPSRAKEFNGNTIFNVNHPDNCQMSGGHYHDPSTQEDPTEKCFYFDISDWVDNRIKVITTGVPVSGQIGPHGFTNTCIMVQVFKTIDSPSVGSFKEVDVEIIIDSITKEVNLRRSPLGAEFSGKVILDSKG